MVTTEMDRCITLTALTVTESLVTEQVACFTQSYQAQNILYKAGRQKTQPKLECTKARMVHWHSEKHTEDWCSLVVSIAFKAVTEAISPLNAL